jgi:hypothetical protein
MEEVRALQISVIKYTGFIVALASVALVIGLQLMAIPYILGLILGSTISVLTFMLLANTLVKASFMSAGRAQIYMGVNYFLRFAIIAIVLYISTQMPYLNVFATVIGIFMVKGILYFIQLGDKRQLKQNFKRKEE